MSVQKNCRHYSTRTTGADVVQRCRVDANDPMPFGCPDGCLFFEARALTTGWERFDDHSPEPPT